MRAFSAVATLGLLLALAAGCSDEAPKNADPGATEPAATQPREPVAARPNEPAAAQPKEPAAGAPRISGPYEHANLAVFLIHGRDRVAAAEFLTLQEAMERKLVTVHETGNVNELSVENLSPDKAVYLQCGDIVKGGKQDRTLQYDIVLSPRSGKVPLPSFCVEQGRWTARGKESSASFASSNYALNTKDLRMAAGKQGDQSQVWSKVAEAQGKLSANAGQTVSAPESRSSLQLTLENEKLKEKVAEYTKALVALPEGKADVVGFAFAVNGKISSVDTYAAGALFRKQWPKLLEAAATEAFGELKPGAAPKAPAPEDVGKFMAEVEKAAAAEKDVSKRSKTAVQENKAAVLLESRDKEQKDEWIHRAYLAK